MAQYSIGDLSQSTLTRMQSTRLKLEMMKLTEELSSGVVSNVATHLSGDMGAYADVQSNLRMLEGYDLAAREASHFADSTQSTLERIYALTQNSLEFVLPATTTTLLEIRDNASLQAQYDLETMIGALNGASAGRSLFAGTSTDQPALIAPDTFLDTLKAGLGPVTDAATLIAEVENWFDSAVGFEASAYLGSSTDLSPAQVSADEEVVMSTRADTAELKNVMESLAIAALVMDPSYGLSTAEQSVAFQHTAEAMISAQTGLNGLQAKIGAAQERIDTAMSRNASTRLSLEEASAGLVGADPFEVATRLEDVQVRIEALYAVTARMSRLSLINYI